MKELVRMLFQKVMPWQSKKRETRETVLFMRALKNYQAIQLRIARAGTL
jgi:hypothetical protein